METLKVYKLKEDYRQLFTNLGSGGTFQVADAFAPPPDAPFQSGDAPRTPSDWRCWRRS
jgi:hypothetical protein